MKDKIKYIFAAWSLLLFAIACFNPIFVGGEKWEGLLSLIFGVFGIVMFPLFFIELFSGNFDYGYFWNFVWLANPLYVAVIFLLCKSKYKSAIKISGLSLLLASSFIFCNRLVTSESGSPREIGAKDIGYYLWLFAFVFMFVACIVGYWLDRKGGKP